MTELVVFDLAGTTVHDDDAVGGALQGALGAFGAAADAEAIREVMGLPKPFAIRTLLTRERSGVTDEEVASCYEVFVRLMQRHYAESPDVAEIPGAELTFQTLRSGGVRVALNTGFARAITEPLLARLGWTVPETVDAVISSDEVERGRPYPDMIERLMEQFGIQEAAAVAKVGDTWADLEEGANTGCGLNIGVTSGVYSWEKLMERPHTHILASVADVPQVVFREVD